MNRVLIYLLNITTWAATLSASHNGVRQDDGTTEKDSFTEQRSLDITGKRAAIANRVYANSMERYFRLDINKQCKIIEDHVDAGDYSKAAGYFMALAKSDTPGESSNANKAISMLQQKLSRNARFVILMEAPADWIAEMLLKLRNIPGDNAFTFVSPKNCEGYQPRKSTGAHHAEIESKSPVLVPTQFFEMDVNAFKPWVRFFLPAQHRIKQYLWLMEAANEQYRHAALLKVVAILEAILKRDENNDNEEAMDHAVYEIFTATTAKTPQPLDIEAFKGAHATPENRAWLLKHGECIPLSNLGTCGPDYALAQEPSKNSKGMCCKPLKSVVPPNHLISIEFTRISEEPPTTLFLGIAPYISKDENPLFLNILSDWYSKNRKAVTELIHEHKENLCPLLVSGGADTFLEDDLANMIFEACYEYSKNDIMDAFNLDTEIEGLNNQMIILIDN